MKRAVEDGPGPRACLASVAAVPTAFVALASGAHAATTGIYAYGNSAAGRSIEELSRPEYDMPHKQIGVTTVGKLRAIGGDVTPNALPHNPFHALVSGITAAQANSLLTPTRQNPNIS